MGTDITWLVEKQNEALVSNVEFEIYRNYQLFFALSGIRRETVRGRGHTQEPFFVPRFEVPADASHELRAYCEYNDELPYDYRLLSELLACDWTWTQSNIALVLEQMNYAFGNPERVRAIWFFD